MILKYPPPASFLNFTSAKSGSIPVVSQSITNPMVPVGAITEVCAFLKPYFSPSASALFQLDCASITKSWSGQLSQSSGTGFMANSS